MKQIFDWIPNEKILHLKSHRFVILFWRSDCYPTTGPKFCAILLTRWVHADNSHPSHYLVDPYTWTWSPNGHDHGHEWPTATSFVECQSTLPFWDTSISKFDHENPWSRSCVRSKVKVTFDLQNSKVTVMVKFKPISHIWGLEFNRYVCFPFRGNRTIFGWDIANSIFDLENSRSRSCPRPNPVVKSEP